MSDHYMGGSIDSSARTVAGMFAGIGGLELGLHEGGKFRTVALCENDIAAQTVLAKRFDAPVFADITKLTSTRLPARIDVLTAGFPCQDLSQAGALAGIAGDRSSLVDEVFRILRGMRQQGRPIPWVVLENVPFMLHLARGAAMRHVLEMLEGLGYEWAYRVVDAHSFGLPQRRRRVFIVASTEGHPADVLLADESERPNTADWDFSQPIGFYWTEGNRGMGRAIGAIPTLKGGSGFGIASPPAVLLGDGRVVTPTIEAAERMQGFPEGWTSPATGSLAKLRWRMVGNAVNVRVARWLGERLDTPGAFDGARRGRRIEGPWPKAACSYEGAAYEVSASEWPCTPDDQVQLDEVLENAKPLSARATRGFADRLERSRAAGYLRVPDRFLTALRDHQEIMEAHAAASATS